MTIKFLQGGFAMPEERVTIKQAAELLVKFTSLSDTAYVQTLQRV